MINAIRFGGGLLASDLSVLRMLAMQRQSPLCVFFLHRGSSAVWGKDGDWAEEKYGVQRFHESAHDDEFKKNNRRDRSHITDLLSILSITRSKFGEES